MCHVQSHTLKLPEGIPQEYETLATWLKKQLGSLVAHQRVRWVFFTKLNMGVPSTFGICTYIEYNQCD